MITKRLERLFLQLFIHASEMVRDSRTSAVKKPTTQLRLAFISLDALIVTIHTERYVASTQESKTQGTKAA
jgi:hypothetical protein